MEGAAMNHKEAFCLMEYQDQVTGEIEVLWNSRNGVTPFIITSRAGNEAQHVHWHKDKPDPNYLPPKGMRIFVDARPTHSHIRRSARDYVEKYWNLDIGRGMTMRNTMKKESGAEMTKGEVIDHFISEWTKPGSPTVVTWKEWRERNVG
jgi:hypothetical protein